VSPEDLEALGAFPVVMAGIFGLLVGSFLNVCIVRWGAEPKQSVVKPRSRCPACGHAIAWYENIPVLSWLALRGKCRGCGARISAMYPLVELAVGAIWAWCAWRFGLALEALQMAAFATILLGIALTDARNYIIPDEFSLGGLVIGLAIAAAMGWPELQAALLGATLGFGLLWITGALGSWILKQEAMGGGDIKMMAMVGAFVGWQGVLLTIFLGALLGSLIFVPLQLMGRKKLIPFGIFLAIGAWATTLWGQRLVAWYTATYWGA
jgi:leader peptidase (prepilin peptidase)/N-methyltransferase